MSSNLTLNQSGFANLTIRGSSTVLMLRSGAIVPVATANTAGSVIIGANLTVDGNGVLSVILPANYTLPVANATQLGGVKVGANLAIDGNGVLSANTPNVSGYMPSMPPVTNGNLTLSTTPSATTTIQGWQTTGLLASNSTVNQIGFSQSGAAGINMVQWRYPTAGGSINQIGLLSLSSGGITSCSTTYDSSANYTSSTRISQSSTALSFFGNRYVSNGTLDGTGCISLSFASVGQPLTGNSTICQLNSTGNLTGSARQSQLYCIANATNTYIGVGGFTSQNLYWDDNSLLIRSYADGRYLTPSNAAASYYPLTGNPSGFLTVLPVANATQLGGVKIGSNISADANGVISVAIPAGYTLPTANTTQLGGVKVGANLTIDANGVLSANASGGGDVTQAGNNTFSGVNTFNNGVTVNATLSLNSNVISRPKIAGYTESASVPTISGGNLTLDLASGNVFGPVALNAAVTNMTISNVPASGTAASFTLLLKANGTALSFTWPTSILWPSAATPNITSTANKVDAFTFVTVDGGTSFIGFKAGQNY